MFSSAGAYPLALYNYTDKKTSDDRPRCLENPRPEGAEPTLTENAASPFPAEPAHSVPARPQSAPSSQVSANDLARRVITNELTFQDDHTNWMYRLEKEQSGKKRVERTSMTRSTRCARRRSRKTFHVRVECPIVKTVEVQTF
jgi:hypothetical protein